MGMKIRVTAVVSLLNLLCAIGIAASGLDVLLSGVRVRHF